MPKRLIVLLTISFLALTMPTLAAQSVTPDKEVNDLLERIRQKHLVPALAGAIVTTKGLEAIGAVGVRKAGTDVAASVEDLWHIGSDTKAMTAVLIGRLVEQGKLKWETTIAEVFPDLAAPWPQAFREITLLHLLSHRAGLAPNLLCFALPKTDPVREQRLAALKLASSIKLLSVPGEKYLYSNLGYVIAGTMAEKAGDAPWEELVKTLIFEPLGMKNVGYGGVGTPGQIDQPWGHAADGKPVAGNGPDMDNPPVVGPAGRVHCSLGDWAMFIADQLRGGGRQKALLKPETYQKLHTPPFGGNYALGWLVVEREWGGGPVLTHAGSNTMNYAVAWLALKRDFAVLVVTNQGGEAAGKACDEAASALIRRHQKSKSEVERL
jgi:CubicO group peptidase (beta-lactamase class C family)